MYNPENSIKEDTYIGNTEFNRVEVIDSTGRVYTGYNLKHVAVGVQDNGRTLKIFVKESIPYEEWEVKE